MKTSVYLIVCVAILGSAELGTASDHADPMSLNSFLPQDAPLANITDLHAFVVKANGDPVLTAGDLAARDQLVISLCVRRRLLYWQIDDPELERALPKLSFRVHVDLNPDVTHFHEQTLPDGTDYSNRRQQFDEDIRAAKSARDKSKSEVDDLKRRIDAAHLPASDTSEFAQELDLATKKLAKDENNYLTVLNERERLLASYQLARRMEALYGATINNPDTIAEEATLDFRLRLLRDDTSASVEIDSATIAGINGITNLLPSDRVNVRDLSALPPGGSGKVDNRKWNPGSINVQAGIFDDPFIFPRFFRGNVFGIVVSVPLALLRQPDGSSAHENTILLWATTHKGDGTQSDHVGRSLRTQLPRFGYLNPFHPSRHVASILRRHSNPTLFENSLTTFIAPLEAHRFYDLSPDVMVYDLTKLARFPNGRWLEDDVAATLKDAGEPLLYELSLAESRQFPRATTNDKPFRKKFPYLPAPWSKQELEDHKWIGTECHEVKS
jgi:hypothetical protein